MCGDEGDVGGRHMQLHGGDCVHGRAMSERLCGDVV